MLGSVFCWAGLVQNTPFLSPSSLIRLIFLGCIGFFTPNFLRSASYNQWGQLVDDYGNIASDAHMPQYYPTGAGVAEEYDDPNAMQARLRQGYNPDLNYAPGFTTSMPYGSRAPSPMMYAPDIPSMPYQPFDAPDDDPFAPRQQRYGLQPHQELLAAMQQGQFEDQTSFQYRPMPTRERQDYFRTHAQKPLKYKDPRAKALYAQTNFMESEQYRMEKESRKAQDKLMRRMVDGRGEEVASLQDQLAQQSQQLQALQAQGFSGRDLQAKLREWQQRTSDLEAKLEAAESQGQDAALSAEQHHAAFRARAQELNAKDVEIAQMRHALANQNAALRALQAQPPRTDPALLQQHQALLAAQQAKISELNAYIDEIQKKPTQQPTKAPQTGREGEKLTYHQPGPVSTNFGPEFAVQAAVSAKKAAEQADLITQITDALGKPETTKDDFKKLLQQTSKGSKTPIISGALLSKYFEKFDVLYTNYKQQLDDLEKQGESANAKELKKARLEIDQINKLRSALELRRQQDLQDAQARFKLAQKRVQTLETDPDASQAMRGTLLTNNRIAATGTSSKRKKDVFIGKAQKIIEDDGAPYTRLQAAQDRMAAVEEEVRKLEDAEMLTGKKPGTSPKRLEDGPKSPTSVLVVHSKTGAAPRPGVTFGPGTKPHDGGKKQQRIARALVVRRGSV